MRKRDPNKNVPADLGLSPRQHLFAAEYLRDFDGKNAAMRAGYSPKTARVQASRLCRKAKIKSAIEAAKAERLVRIHAEADRVVIELERLAMSNLRRVFDEDGRLKAIRELDDETAASIASFKVLREKTTRLNEGNVAVTVEEAVIEVKLWDKPRALELLGKHLGIIKERHEHTGKDRVPLIPVNRLSDAELKAELEAAAARF